MANGQILSKTVHKQRIQGLCPKMGRQHQICILGQKLEIRTTPTPYLKQKPDKLAHSQHL